MEQCITQAIESIKNDIDELQTKIGLLNSLDENTIVTENVYHELCDTDLRRSDFLGQLVAKQIPELKYDKQSPNYFHYTTDNKDIDVCIPSSAVKNVNLLVFHYYGKNTSDILREFNINSKTNQINRIEHFLQTKNFKYFIAVISGKKRKAEKYLKELIDERDRLEKAYKDWQNDQITHRNEQQLELRKYIDILLNWTNEVRVYSKSMTSYFLKVTKDNGEIKYNEF